MGSKLMRRLLLLAVTVLAAGTSPLAAGSLTDAQKSEVKFALKQNTAYEFIATVESQSQQYRFVTFVPDFEGADGLSKQRALMGWKGDFLFIRQQCGQPTQWRCVVDQVFTKVGESVVHVGSVESGACKAIGCSYAEPIFWDLFDLYQVNPVTGATDAPPLLIARRFNGKTLSADLETTWNKNAPAYRSSIECLDQVARDGFSSPCANNQSPWSALVFVAKLTHYTGRQAEWMSLFSNQAVGYCSRSADPKCEWRVAGAKEFFSRFLPGALPQFTPSPVTMGGPGSSPRVTEEKIQLGKPIKLAP